MKNLAFKISGASYSYSGRDALRGVSLECHEGEWLALVGRNGSGKSTLLKFLNALLIPTQGSCFVFGMDTAEAENTIEIRKQVAMVFQNPESQIVGVTVEDDTAFALENLCLPSDEIEKRISAALKETGLLEMRKNLTHTLSGGEKQRLALAGAIAQGAKMFLFDEATSMLDPEGRGAMLSHFKKLHDEGCTIVQITHDDEEIRATDRVITLDEGRVSPLAWQFREPKRASESEFEISFSNDRYRLFKKIGGAKTRGENETQKISACSLSHSYDGITKKEIFRDISFEFLRGETISLLGRSGSGKSTLIQYLNALFLTEKNCGDVLVNGENIKKRPRAFRRKVGMVFQQPEQQLFAETVREELLFALKNWEVPEEEYENLTREALEHVGLPLSMLERCPFKLSGGEMRRVAIASTLVSKPEWLVLDEPAAGLDRDGKKELSELLSNLKSQGTGLLVVTHDRNFAYSHSDKIIELA